MEIKNIFDCNEYRNVLLEILSYLTYDEISHLLYLDKKSRKYIRDFLFLDENRIVLRSIIQRRFFDRRDCNFILNDSFIQPKFTISNDKTFWKTYYPNIQDGDIIYLKNCDKFVNINSAHLFVRYEYDDRQVDRELGKGFNLVFPIEYWKKIGRKYPFRFWITVKVYYESLRVWMTNQNFRFIDLDLDPNLYKDNIPIEICFTYVEEIIYIYNGRK
jgi:hypothetical protein